MLPNFVESPQQSLDCGLWPASDVEGGREKEREGGGGGGAHAVGQ